MFRKTYRENHDNNMKLFNKKGMLDDVLDLMAFVLIAVFSLFFIYAALISGIDGRNAQSLYNVASVVRLHNAVIGQQNDFHEGKPLEIVLLKNQLLEFTSTEIPGVKEYSEAELQQLQEEARTAKQKRETLQTERSYRGGIKQ